MKTRRVGLVAGVAAIGLAVFATPTLLNVSPASAVGTCSVLANSGSDLRAKLAAMDVSQCTTLLIPGGTYDVGTPGDPGIINAHEGTETQGITVMAQNSADKPIILGAIKMTHPSYWTFDGLRFKGTSANNDPDNLLAGDPPLEILGGRSWHITNSEFWSVAGYQSRTILGISNETAHNYAQGFLIDNSCFHNASELASPGGTSANDQNKDHLVYVTTPWLQSDPEPLASRIERNTFYVSKNGGAIEVKAPNISVFYNTFNVVQTALTMVTIGSSPDGTLAPLQDVVASRNLVTNLSQIKDGNQVVQPDRPYQATSLHVRPRLGSDQVQGRFVSTSIWDDNQQYKYATGVNTLASEVAIPSTFTWNVLTSTQADPQWDGGLVGGCGPAYYKPTNPNVAPYYGRYATS